MSARNILLAGLVFMAGGVMLGAFGAHMLKASVHPDLLKVWHTGVEYQFYHALGLIGLGIWARQGTGSVLRPTRTITISALSFAIGILLFSGSLYVMVLSGQRALGIITPFGGIAFILGWISWIVALLRGAGSEP